MELLSVRRRELEDGWVVELDGQLDVATAPRLRQVLQEVQKGRPRRVVVDLTRLGLVDSFGLGVLLGGIRRARAAGGALVLAAPPPRVAEVLATAGLDAIVPVVGTVSEAILVPGLDGGGEH